MFERWLCHHILIKSSESSMWICKKNVQQCLLALLEKWKSSIEKRIFFGSCLKANHMICLLPRCKPMGLIKKLIYICKESKSDRDRVLGVNYLWCSTRFYICSNIFRPSSLRPTFHH